VVSSQRASLALQGLISARLPATLSQLIAKSRPASKYRYNKDVSRSSRVLELTYWSEVSHE